MGEDAVARSVEAIRTGAEVILQPALRNGRWFGRPDVLRRNGMPSHLALGPMRWSTLSSRRKRGRHDFAARALLELLGIVQGMAPECFHVVTPDPVTPVSDVSGRRLRCLLPTDPQSSGGHLASGPALLAAENYPEPVDHCEICRWQRDCDRKRRHDDHLSLVAGMRRLQSREFEAAGISTLAQLGALSLPLPLRLGEAQ